MSFAISRKPVPKEPLPCTRKRGFAHNWVCDEPVGNVVHARCRFCRRKREYPAFPSYEQSYNLTLSRDPLPKRNDVGAFGLYS